MRMVVRMSDFFMIYAITDATELDFEFYLVNVLSKIGQFCL